MVGETWPKSAGTAAPTVGERLGEVIVRWGPVGELAG